MAKFYYGGQAVMEGVMMRGRTSAAVAVRRPDESIYIYEETLNPRLYQNKLFRLPFLRGMLLLWDMLVLGTRLMTLSANIATGAIDPTTPAEQPTIQNTDELPTVASEQAEGEKPIQLGGVALAVTLLISLTFAVAIFFVTPLLIISLLHKSLGDGLSLLMFEGLIRLSC